MPFIPERVLCKYLHSRRRGFYSSKFCYGLGKYSPQEYLGPFGVSPLPRGLEHQKVEVDNRCTGEQILEHARLVSRVDSTLRVQRT